MRRARFAHRERDDSVAGVFTTTSVPHGQLPVERLPADAEDRGRTLLVPAAGSEDGDDVRLLDICETLRRAGPASGVGGVGRREQRPSANAWSQVLDEKLVEALIRVAQEVSRLVVALSSRAN